AAKPTGGWGENFGSDECARMKVSRGAGWSCWGARAYPNPHRNGRLAVRREGNERLTRTRPSRPTAPWLERGGLRTWLHAHELIDIPLSDYAARASRLSRPTGILTANCRGWIERSQVDNPPIFIRHFFVALFEAGDTEK